MQTLQEIYEAHTSPTSKPKTINIDEKNKYKNKRVFVDGINFQSKGEALYYLELKMLFERKHIKGFKRQVQFELVVNGVRIGKYIADFCILHHTGKIEVVDHKSKFTATLPEYILKKQLMLACYGIAIKEVNAK